MDPAPLQVCYPQITPNSQAVDRYEGQITRSHYRVQDSQCGICALELFFQATPAEEMHLQRRAIRILLMHPTPIVTFESRVLFDSDLVADEQLPSSPLPSLWEPWSQVVQPAESMQTASPAPAQQIPLPHEATTGPSTRNI